MSATPQMPSDTESESQPIEQEDGIGVKPNLSPLQVDPPLTEVSGNASEMTQEKFFAWFSENHGPTLEKTMFNMHAGYLFTEIQSHAFSVELANQLTIWDKSFIAEKGHPLLMNLELPPLNRKSYDSTLNKIYRINCVRNKRFPDAPSDGWVDERNYLSSINDLVRNKISCKFIDGPELVANHLAALAKRHGLRCDFSSRNYDDGYYAYHFYVYFPIEFFTNSGKVTHDVALEIQISTQLKEVMYEILHKFYADERSKNFREDWKWDIGSLKFKSGYLSHTLHMLEAMIVELRDEI